MPNRHNNHQIEDASRRRFDTLLPDAWVSRPKASDYGTDVEVEVFEEDGTATGLMFYVQLRGTDDPTRETKTRLSIDQLHYFQQLDVPTLLVRFCRPTGAFYCKWHYEIHATPKQEQQKTMAVNFADEHRWKDETLKHIATDLKVARYASDMPNTGRISVSFDTFDLGPSKRFEFKSALLKASAVYRAICSPDALRSDEHLPVQVALLDNSILVSCGKLTNVEVPVGGSGDDLATALLYAICILCFDLGCLRQAQDAARSILQHRIQATDSWAAFRAAEALHASPSEMVAFAFLNGLEDPSLVENPLVTMLLVDASPSSISRDWLQSWFETVETFALQHDMVGPAAATNYNRGNAALQSGEFAEAVRFYNKARKLRPEYLATDYYLQEFGGALYNARHYAPASRLYASAITETSSATDWHRLGDAQLLSGEIGLATKSYETAEVSQRLCPEKFSLQLKLSLCDWLLEKYGEKLFVRWHKASTMLRHIEERSAQQEQEYKKILLEANALDPVSNFNVGTSCAKRSEFEDALHHYSLCGIQCPHDLEAWSNTMKCAWNIDHHAFLAVLSAAYAHNALDGYALFRSDLVNQGMPDNLIEMLDALVGELDDPTQVSEDFSKFVQRHFSNQQKV